ncbi:MAG: hypothetical protein M3463_19845 [Verrucomicrobiota bacterium]|nr:hypothetical protein [Verrucomicrobiota bacterium]
MAGTLQLGREASRVSQASSLIRQAGILPAEAAPIRAHRAVWKGGSLEGCSTDQAGSLNYAAPHR